VPTLLTASAIPLATNRVIAMVATINMVRLINYPSTLFSTRLFSSEVGASGGRRKPHTDHSTPSSPYASP
jgi:hypothetical protein